MSDATNESGRGGDPAGTFNGDAIGAARVVDDTATDAAAEWPTDAELEGWLQHGGEADADTGPATEADEASDEADGSPSGPLPRFELIVWRRGWKSGVYWLGIDDRSGKPKEPLWLCDPLRILALTRDGTGHGWGRLLEWQDQDRRVHRWAVPARLLVGDGMELAAALADRGLTLANGRARAKLLDYLAQARPGQFARCVQRTGWAGRSFVLPDEVIGDAGGEPVVFQAPSPEGAKFAVAGTLAGWRREVAAACVGNTRLTFAVCVALAGPVLGLLDAEPGGFHLFGPTSAGKSTALKVAASVWGPPAFVKSWRMTSNGIEGVAAVHTDTLLCLDELGELGARDAAQVAYSLANGSGKTRARTDGAARAPATWRVLFLSTGEIQLADLIGEAGGRTRGGQEVRAAAIPADAGAGLGLFDRLPAGMTAGQFADSLKDGAGAHYGRAGRRWLEYLTSHYAEARDALRQLRDGFAEELVPNDAAGAVRRVAHRFALIGAAGEVASAAGITGWPVGEAQRAARACFRVWLDARGTAGAPEPLAMLRQVRRILERDGESRFSPLHPDGTADSQAFGTRDRLGFRRSVEGGTEYLVLREQFRQEIAAGFDAAAVAAALAAVGALKLDSDGAKTRKEYLPGLGRQRVYVITPRIWDAAT
jgi:putative DNA primase/helicase